MTISESAKDLIPLNFFSDLINSEVIYTNPNHPDNHFEALYHPEAKILWLEKTLAIITLKAAKLCKELYGWQLLALDGFRPVEAQKEMQKFGYHPSLVAPPGQGGHPRGMAIDIVVYDDKKNLIDMGTPFDFFAKDPVTNNPAARNYTQFTDDPKKNLLIWENRSKLEFAMRQAAAQKNKQLFPLPTEWWDFRYMPSYTNSYQPLREENVFSFQRMIKPNVSEVKAILKGEIPDEISEAIEFVRKKI